ncbi:MAG: fimbrillin family protein [Staphylococcus sp.]|nr:fimbrillin family protein [Staphylococcus sp.]
MNKPNYHHKAIARMTLAALAALPLWSCGQSDDPVAGPGSHDSVTFGAYITKAAGSRAFVADIESLKQTGFAVFASQTGNDDFNPDASAGFTPDFMYNQKVEWLSGAWAYSPVKNWPGSKLSFFAYAPYTEAGGKTGIVGMTGPQDAGSPKLSFRVNSDVDSQIDLLYSDATSTVNLFNEDRVQLLFCHALSRIGFSCTIDESVDANSTLTINSLTFRSSELGVTGDLDLCTGKWENLSKREMAYTLSVAGADFVDTDDGISSADGKYLMIIPSDAEVPVEITVDYDVTTTDDKLAGGSLTVHNSISTSFNHNFETGKAYYFTLRLSLKTVDVNIGVADWDDDETDWKPKE